jgi:Cd2+/Zn2+-exporting ATPase
MDKTGTITKGIFKVQDVIFKPEFNQTEILSMVNVLESKSTHPIASAVHQLVGKINTDIVLEDVKEIPGYGLKATIAGKELIVGNFKLLDKFNVKYDFDTTFVYTLIAIAYDKQFVGYLTIADVIKDDAQDAINKLNLLGVKTTILSGDKYSVVKYVADKLGIINSFGDLLPEDKVNKLKAIKDQHQTVAFVGDGINDAPVIALSNVGIAMGGLGSDVTIETADIVIQDDKPSKIPMAINIGKQTKKIVWQNIILAFTVKGLVLLLGAGGLATMWEAVFADVGVALLAILNAVRIQQMKF